MWRSRPCFVHATKGQTFGVVARGKATRPNLPEGWRRRLAQIAGILTTRVEVTAAWRVDGTSYFASNHGSRALTMRVGDGYRVQERFCVRM